MKRFLCALMLLAGPGLGLVNADYLLIKINLQNYSLDVKPPDPNQPDQPQPQRQPQPAPMPGQEVVEVKPQWIYANLELKGKPKIIAANIAEIEHNLGKKLYLPSHETIQLQYIGKRDTLAKELDRLQRGDPRDKEDPKRILYYAGWALQHGLMKEFHAGMEELKKVDPKRPAVTRYLSVLADLKKLPTSDDPGVASLMVDLRSEFPRTLTSSRGHYALMTNLLASPQNDATLRRRLSLMESAHEGFFFWWALQEAASFTPPMPKHRLLAVHINDATGFHNKHAYWDASPLYAAGFTPHRDNVMILCGKRLDPAFTMLEKNNRNIWNNSNISWEEMLNGLVWTRNDVALTPYPRAMAQVLAVVEKAMEDECERTTITHEATCQLLVATSLLPRNVEVPQWVRFGLASFFETSYGSLYPSLGLPSATHLINFKYFRKKGKLPSSQEALYKTLSDYYFRQARQTAAEKADTTKDRDTIHEKVQEELELARATSWALAYYLARSNRLNALMDYCRELEKLPRDLELDERLLQGCFAQAFKLTAKDGRSLNPTLFQSMADDWFANMESFSLEIAELERENFRFRMEMNDPKKTIKPAGAATTGS